MVVKLVLFLYIVMFKSLLLFKLKVVVMLMVEVWGGDLFVDILFLKFEGIVLLSDLFVFMGK